ncbi:hypothetical protein [Mycolicibacterium llatzerense]|uniref:hypothetical protein n=1 Tax=Mycolicibacterium llatzerense TaxID=280871 RepID=UPI0008DD98BF|nr:hypothetical protein [Mycolicibacterium llatzerense]
MTKGFTYAAIVRAIKDNDPAAGISVKGVERHAARHFAFQNAAGATYRQILERRAAENNIDFVNAVGTAITPIAYLETLYVRAFEHLTSEDAPPVDLKVGLQAAVHLQQILANSSDQLEVAGIMAQLNRLVAVVKSVVPQEFHSAILAALDGAESAMTTPSPAIQTTQIDEFDPGDDFDEDDED